MWLNLGHLLNVQMDIQGVRLQTLVQVISIDDDQFSKKEKNSGSMPWGGDLNANAHLINFCIIQKWQTSSIFIFCPFSHEKKMT